MDKNEVTANEGQTLSTSIRNSTLKDVLIASIDECVADGASTATEKLVAITEAVKVLEDLT